MSKVPEKGSRAEFHPLLRGEGQADPIYLDEPYSSPWPGCIIGFPPGGAAMAALLPNSLDETSRTPILEIHVDRLKGNAWTTMEFDIAEQLSSLVSPEMELALVGRIRSIPHYEMHANVYVTQGTDARTIPCGSWQSTYQFQPFKIPLPTSDIANMIERTGGASAAKADQGSKAVGAYRRSAGGARVGVTGLGGTWFTVQLSDFGILVSHAK